MMWPEEEEDSYLDDDGYPHRDDAEYADRLYEHLSGGATPTAYWVFGEETILGGCTTEALIVEAVEHMDDVAQDLRDAGHTEWLDYFGWDRDALVDTLFDIRSLPESTRGRRRHRDRMHP